MYDVVIIGAGIGGYTAAIRAAQEGLSVAIVEKDLVGGTCLNRGCIPTKSYLHVANEYSHLSLHHEIGIEIGNISLNRDLLSQYIVNTVDKLRDGIEFLLRTNKITVYKGKAIVRGASVICVKRNDGEELIEGKNLIIATGSVPNRLNIPGSKDVNVITSDEIFERENLLPASIGIMGGGIVGIEFAYLLNKLGSQVIIVENTERILGNFDCEISDNVTRYLLKMGIQIHTSSSLSAIENEDDEMICTINTKNGNKSFIADKVLMAIGRKANINLEGLEELGIDVENGIITTDNNMETNIKGIYAIGDVAGKGQLAYVAAAQGICAIAHIVGKDEDFKFNGVPSCVFIDPEVVCIGESEGSAQIKGIDVRVGRNKMSSNGKAVLEKNDSGYIKIIIDRKKDTIIGAQVFCKNAIDMSGMLELIINNEILVKDVISSILPHPSYLEAIKEAIEDAYGRSISMMNVKRGNAQ